MSFVVLVAPSILKLKKSTSSGPILVRILLNRYPFVSTVIEL